MGSIAFECRQLPRLAGSQVDFGVEVTGLDIENISGKQLEPTRIVDFFSDIVLIR